jgi:endonuclease/exonuclease/phosphatase (EEP) superfamily protein YafD
MLQVEALAARVVEMPQPRIVMGDFNATPYSRVLRRFAEVTGMTLITNLPTWPAQGLELPQLSIDHMFIDPKLKIAEPAIAGLYAGSDHLPIAAKILVPISGRVTGGTNMMREPINVSTH